MNRNMRTKRALGLVLVIMGVLLIGTQDTMADLVKRPSDMVHLHRYVPTDSDRFLREVDDEGINQGDFTVANRHVFVIRTVTITPSSPGAGLNLIAFRQHPVGGSVLTRMFWMVPSDRTTQLQFTPGIVVAPGYDVKALNFATSQGTVTIYISGYLTRDK